MPGPELLENQDNIYIGGCIVTGDDPDLGCKNCNWQGFIGDIDLVEEECVALVVDLGRKRFVAGVFFHAGRPESALTRRPGIAEFQQGLTAQWLEEQIASCKEPSFWLGKRREIMPGAFEEILLGYPTITEEVMQFAGFDLLKKSPVFAKD
jgi:hypothetical protein